MKYSILLTLLIIFSLVGCEGGGDTGVPDDKSFNKGGAKTAGQAALKFFNKIREKDVKYCYFHSLPYHRWLKDEMEKRHPKTSYLQERLPI